MTDRSRVRPGPPRPLPQPAKPRKQRKGMKSPYPSWFYIPAGVLFIVFFAVPTFASFYFSLTRWTLFDVAVHRARQLRRSSSTSPQLVQGFINTFIYGFITSAGRSCSASLLGAAADRPRSRPRLPAGRGLLPGAGVDHRRRPHLQGAARPVPRPRQQRPRLLRHLPEPGWYTDPNLALSRSPASTSGRASASPR